MELLRSTDIDKPQMLMTAAFLVAAWASHPERIKDQIDFASPFLRQWPMVRKREIWKA